MNRKKNEKDKDENIEIICNNCQTVNDTDASYCKKCGLPITNSLKKSKVFMYLNIVFKILSLTMIIEILWITKPLIGTPQWDNIIIEYSLILSFTLLLATFFRLLSEEKNITDMIKKETFKELQTRHELNLILLIVLGTIGLFIYTNTRIVFLKPGNNYVERKVEEHTKRWYKARYERTGSRRCTNKKRIIKNIYIPNLFCYEYTYRITFRDGDTCFIHYTSEYNHKINEEKFSYCSKK